MNYTTDSVPTRERQYGFPLRSRSRRGTLAIVTVLALVLVGLVPSSMSTHSDRGQGRLASSVVPLPPPPAPRPTVPVPPHPNPGGLQCDGMYWADWVWANYSPSWCYGHDEPTMSFVSTAPGSGGDANYSLTLPADGTYTQGDFYATIWFGGVVYDPGSISNQAYLELQLYPAPPMFTGPGSGANDCLPNGAFNPVYTPGSNIWFACAIVWQVTSTENAAFAGPLDVHGTTSILEFRSNDHLFVNLTGVAQSATQPWQITLTDTTTNNYGTVALQNGSKILPPYYSTAAAANVLAWGASQPGAVAFSYEIGHALNPVIPAGGTYGGCYPGDLACDSYWPGRWAQSGQLQLTLPIMGLAASRTFPTQIGLSSSAGGESWINNTGAGSTCTGPNWSTATNCIYPWYIYRGQNYSLTFDANNLTNDTHDYGNWYQFPGVASSHATHAAPWGTLNSTVTPATATVDFNPLRTTHVLTVLPGGKFSGQFMEGPYWLNVSAPGCVSSSTFVYLKTAALYNTPVILSCRGVYAVTFNEVGLPLGTPWSVTYNGTTMGGTGGTGIVFHEPNGTVPYTVLSPIPGAAGIRYLATPSGGNVVVNGAPVPVPVSYVTQYQFTATASPAAGGTATPASSWSAPGTVIQATATVSPGWAFSSWSGVGSGSYTGTANPASVTLNGPVQETALFILLFAVSFTETGLPSGATWNVTLNGRAESTTTTSITFQLPNGSISYTVSGPAGYSVTPRSGSDTVNGSNLSVQVQFSKPVILGLTYANLELLFLLVVAVIVAIVVAVAVTRRKRPPSATPAYASQPPPWVSGPPPR
ncbi:MAG: hypothetical protein L3K14_00455 [Thermoplasmata archaeon]|nr:hypothetical protein [Thermoplasmata archaeon]